MFGYPTKVQGELNNIIVEQPNNDIMKFSGHIKFPEFLDLKKNCKTTVMRTSVTNMMQNLSDYDYVTVSITSCCVFLTFDVIVHLIKLVY